MRQQRERQTQDSNAAINNNTKKKPYRQIIVTAQLAYQADEKEGKNEKNGLWKINEMLIRIELLVM